MNKTRFMFFMLLGAFGLIAGFGTPTFAAEKSTHTHAKKAGKVDVNSATEQELQELPGIGEAYAKKIIDGRPYKTDADLVKAGIPQSTVDKIKHQIRFGRAKTEKTHMKPEKSSKTDSKAAPRPTKTHPSEEAAKVPPHKGMVWVNKDTMVYHTEGDRWYGNTKNGEFMTERDAIKFGAQKSKQD